jgi:hypothetical protein
MRSRRTDVATGSRSTGCGAANVFGSACAGAAAKDTAKIRARGAPTIRRRERAVRCGVNMIRSFDRCAR